MAALRLLLMLGILGTTSQNNITANFSTTNGKYCVHHVEDWSLYRSNTNMSYLTELSTLLDNLESGLKIRTETRRAIEALIKQGSEGICTVGTREKRSLMSTVLTVLGTLVLGPSLAGLLFNDPTKLSDGKWKHYLQKTTKRSKENQREVRLLSDKIDALADRVEASELVVEILAMLTAANTQVQNVLSTGNMKKRLLREALKMVIRRNEEIMLLDDPLLFPRRLIEDQHFFLDVDLLDDFPVDKDFFSFRVMAHKTEGNLCRGTTLAVEIWGPIISKDCEKILYSGMDFTVTEVKPKEQMTPWLKKTHRSFRYLAPMSSSKKLGSSDVLLSNHYTSRSSWQDSRLSPRLLNGTLFLMMEGPGSLIFSCENNFIEHRKVEAGETVAVNEGCDAHFDGSNSMKQEDVFYHKGKPVRRGDNGEPLNAGESILTPEEALIYHPSTEDLVKATTKKEEQNTYKKNEELEQEEDESIENETEVEPAMKMMVVAIGSILGVVLVLGGTLATIWRCGLCHRQTHKRRVHYFTVKKAKGGEEAKEEETELSDLNDSFEETDTNLEVTTNIQLRNQIAMLKELRTASEMKHATAEENYYLTPNNIDESGTYNIYEN